MTIPASVQEIGVNAFCNCKKLKRVTFAEGSRLEKFGNTCFFESGLEEITVPSSVTTIGLRAFLYCKRLKKVTFQKDSRLRTLGEECFYCSGLEEFVAPPGLRVIGKGAFTRCWSLKRVVLNEGVEALKDHDDNSHDYLGTFYNSGIAEITLPGTLKEIGKYTFSKCFSLKTIYVKGGCRATLSGLDVYGSPKIVRQRGDYKDMSGRISSAHTDYKK